MAGWGSLTSQGWGDTQLFASLLPFTAGLGMMGSRIVCGFTGQPPSLRDRAGDLGSPRRRSGRWPRTVAGQWLGPGSSSPSSAEADVEAAARAAAAAARRLGGAQPSPGCAGRGGGGSRSRRRRREASVQPARARRRGHGRRSDRERLAGAGERGEAGVPGRPPERLQRVCNPRDAGYQVAPQDLQVRGPSRTFGPAGAPRSPAPSGARLWGGAFNPPGFGLGLERISSPGIREGKDKPHLPA